MKDILLLHKVSLLFLIGAMAYGVLTAGYMPACLALLMSMSVAVLVSSFQKKAAMSRTYMSGALMGAASMLWLPALVFLPLHVILLLKPLSALSWRNVIAMLLGVLTPAWLYLPYFLYVHASAMDWLHAVGNYWGTYSTITVLDYSSVGSLHVVAYGILLLFFLGLMLFKTPFSYRGRVFVRTQRAVYMTLAWILAIAMPLLPQLAAYLLPLMAAYIGPVVAQKVIGDGR